MSITGFNPPTATVDNGAAPQARTDGQAAFLYYSGLTPTQSGLANLSTNNGGGGVGVYRAGVFSGGALDIPTSITLDAQGNPNALFVFISASTTVLHSGASILLVNGAQAANVVWVVGSSFTSVATSTMVGNILAYASITLGGGILSGRALAVGGGNGAVSISAATAVTVPAGGGGAITAGDIVTFDVFGNTLDSGISLEGVLSSIFVNPMTTDGDMIYEGLAGSPAVLGPLRLPIGTTGQVLTVAGGVPAWQTPVPPVQFLVTTVDTSAPAPVAIGDIVSWGSAYDDDGVVRAENNANSAPIMGVATTAAAAGGAITIQLDGNITANTSGNDVGQIIGIDPANPGHGLGISQTPISSINPTPQFTAGYSLTASGGGTFTLQLDPSVYTTPATGTTWAGVFPTSYPLQFNYHGSFAGDSGLSVTHFSGLTTLVTQNFYLSGEVVSPVEITGAAIPNTGGGPLFQVYAAYVGTTPLSNYQSDFFVFDNYSGQNVQGSVISVDATCGNAGSTLSDFSGVEVTAPSNSGTGGPITTWKSFRAEDPTTGTGVVLPAYAFYAEGGASFFKGFALNVRGVNSTATATINDSVIDADASAGTFTVNLPTTNIALDQRFIIKKIDTSANAVTVSSTVNIDYALSLNLSNAGDTVVVWWDGAQYWIEKPVISSIPAGGSPTEIQYNLGGVLAGIAGSAVTTVGAVTLAPTGTGVALSVTGDASSSDILDLHANDTTPVFHVDNFGSTFISPETGDTFPALTIQGQVAGTAAMFAQGGGTLTVDNSARLIITPNVGTGASLQVNDDGGGTTDIADFIYAAGPYNVVAIAQPNTGGLAALTVTGDANSSDIQDWFVNGGVSPATWIDFAGVFHTKTITSATGTSASIHFDTIISDGILLESDTGGVAVSISDSTGFVVGASALDIELNTTGSVSIGSVGSTTSIGSPNLEITAHFGSTAANPDLAGTVTITGSTSQAVTFTLAFTSAPIVVVTPTSDTTTVGPYWVSPISTTGFTVNIHTSGTMTFNYVVIGNPN
jgi:hypothetical protein